MKFGRIGEIDWGAQEGGGSKMKGRGLVIYPHILIYLPTKYA
jgi:hypothetical protein